MTGRLFSAGRLALVILGMAALAGPGITGARAVDSNASLKQVRFQLRSDCNCASCGFTLQGSLRKRPGIERVALSSRERVLTVAFDESRVPLSQVAAQVTSTELGKHCALIGELSDTSTAPKALDVAGVPGVRATTVEPKKNRLLVELANGAIMTTQELVAAMAKAGVVVRFDILSR